MLEGQRKKRCREHEHGVSSDASWLGAELSATLCLRRFFQNLTWLTCINAFNLTGLDKTKVLMLCCLLAKQLKCAQVIPGTTSLLGFLCWLADCVIELLILRKLQSYSPTDSHPLQRVCCHSLKVFALRRSEEEHRNQVSFFNLVVFVCLKVYLQF